MSASTALHVVLNDILKVVSPSQKDWDLRFAFIADLRRVVESVESMRGATVEPFGSFVSNLFTRWDDLDVSIVLSNDSNISSVWRKHKIMLLGDLLRALKMEGGWSNLQLISNARLPILRCKSNQQGMSGDISINSFQSQIKSKILLRITRMDVRFRNMVLLVKEWAKALGINDSRVGTLNSYVLTLLVIFHFQTCIPAILPPLKDIYPGNMVYDLRGDRADAEKFIAQTCDANITRFLSDKFKEINKKSLPELFVEFLKKFSQMDIWASELGICPYTGQWEKIKNNEMWLPKTYAILVEDPFELSKNATKFVNTEQLRKISLAFLKTYKMVTSRNQSQTSLLSFLTRRRVSQSNETPCISSYIDDGHCCETLPMHPCPRLQWSQNGNGGRTCDNSNSMKPMQSLQIRRRNILCL